MSLFRWFSKNPPAGQPRPALPQGDLDQTIAAIAALRSEPAIWEGAREFPHLYGPEVIPELRRRFDVLVEPPSSFSARERSATAWFACWQSALYAILYQYREHALPALREMARHCDRAAVVLLCRLAAEGIGREQTVAELRSLLPELPDSLRLGVAAPLLCLARQAPAAAAVVEELRQVPEFDRALAEAQQFEDEDGPPEGGPVRPPERPRDAGGRWALFAAIAMGFGIWAAITTAGPAGVWGAVWVGALAAGFTGAVLFIVQTAVLRRM